MAHRLQHLQKKKVVQAEEQSNTQGMQRDTTQSQQQETHLKTNYSNLSNSLNNQPIITQIQNENHKKQQQMPRPIFPSVNQFYIYDRNAYRKRQPTFPAPESLCLNQHPHETPFEFIRTTSTIISSIPKKLNYPLAAWISPLASDAVHTVQVNSPLRCSRCRAYVNPYFQFDGSRKITTCNICNMKFQVEETVDPQNINSTEVATQNVIDFKVTDKFFMKKRRDVLKLIVAVEVSMTFIELGLLSNILQSIKSAIQNHTFEQKIRFSIIFYTDQGVYFTKICKSSNWKEKCPTTYLIESNKTGNFCCPLSDAELLLDPNSEKDKILFLVDFIQQYAEKYYKDGKHVNNANYVSALKCIQDNFENQAGRVILFSYLDPRQGDNCSIRPRNQEQLKTPLRPIHSEFYQLAKELVKRRVGVIQYLFSKDNIVSHELATTHFLCSMTGGSISLFQNYSHQNHSQILYYSIFKCLTKSYIYDVDLTVRVSNGLNVMRYGSFDTIKETRDISLSIFDPAASFTVEIQHEEKIEESSGAYLQFAMMYTDGHGHRKIRVINFKFQVTSRLEFIYQSADYLTFANIVARNYVNKLYKAEPTKVREEMLNYLSSILATYRLNHPGWNNNKYSELALPKNLEWSLAYLHTIANSRLFLNANKSNTDFRIHQILKINSLNFYHFAMKFYPKLYPLSLDIYQTEPLPGDFLQSQNEDENEERISVLPENLPLSRAFIKDDGVYLYNCGQYLLIIVQPSASSEVLEELFGTCNLEEIEQNNLPELETSHSIRVNNMVNEMRRRNTNAAGIFLPIIIKTALKKGPYNDIVANLLKEDYPQCNYYTFLDCLHRSIQLFSK